MVGGEGSRSCGAIKCPEVILHRILWGKLGDNVSQMETWLHHWDKVVKDLSREKLE